MAHPQRSLKTLHASLPFAPGRFPPARFVLFAGVGLSGVVVQVAILVLLHSLLRWSFLLAQGTSVLVAMVSNYALNNVLTFRKQRLRGAAWFQGLVSFSLACSIGALFNLLAAQTAITLGAQWLLAGLLGTAVGSVFNYVATGRFTWKTSRRQSAQ